MKRGCEIPLHFFFVWQESAIFVSSIDILQNPRYLFHSKCLMKDFVISVRKLTDEALMRDACEMTFLGESHQQLLSIYKSEHSPVRTQLFWVTAKNIPLFVATHLLRHHVGSVPFQLTCRDDRPGGNPGLIKKVESIKEKLSLALVGVENGDYDWLEDVLKESIDSMTWLEDNSDRYTPVNLGLLLNAQSLIDMSKLRLCNQAHKETIQVFKSIQDRIVDIDPDLAGMMVRKCVYRGGICGESRCCGFNHTESFKNEMQEYLSYFSEKQKPCK